MTDKSLLAVEDIPAVAAVGFGGLELGFVVGLDVLVAELLANVGSTIPPPKGGVEGRERPTPARRLRC
eukprot:scaffold9277_cov118-Isochrysis_galbana.AAC.2